MIDTVFKKNKAFIGYMTAGAEELDYQVEAALALNRGGVDILEIGFPYSDPVADGPVIQSAMQRALQRNTDSKVFLNLISSIRKRTTMPLILFSYANPLLQLGNAFLDEAHHAGVDGLLIVDLPMEESHLIPSALQKINLITPSSPDERVSHIARNGEGFLYYVCQKGTTGIRNGMPSDFGKNVQRIKARSKLPVVAGFGINSRETAKEALVHADGFVVGSALVKVMCEGFSPDKLEGFTRSLDPRSARNL